VRGEKASAGAKTPNYIKSGKMQSSVQVFPSLLGLSILVLFRYALCGQTSSVVRRLWLGFACLLVCWTPLRPTWLV